MMVKNPYLMVKYPLITIIHWLSIDYPLVIHWLSIGYPLVKSLFLGNKTAISTFTGEALCGACAQWHPGRPESECLGVTLELSERRNPAV